MLNCLLISIVCAVISYVYCCILTGSGMIFFALPDMIRAVVFNPCKSDEQQPLSVMIFKILIDCEKCNCGQLALWSYLVYALRNGYYQADWLAALVLHLFTISLAILIITFINKAYLWAIN